MGKPFRGRGEVRFSPFIYEIRIFFFQCIETEYFGTFYIGLWVYLHIFRLSGYKIVSCLLQNIQILFTIYTIQYCCLLYNNNDTMEGTNRRALFLKSFLLSFLTIVNWGVISASWLIRKFLIIHVLSAKI